MFTDFQETAVVNGQEWELCVAEALCLIKRFADVADLKGGVHGPQGRFAVLTDTVLVSVLHERLSMV